MISKKGMSTVLAKPPTAEPKAAPSAAEMGARQREISVSEFFTKNRHLLGFDNPRKALLTCVKEAVDNALDAAEEAGILPEVVVRLDVASNSGEAPLPASQATRFRVTVTDNGPGIVRQQIPPIFAKLLYGSKFHRLRMSRGQQGIGISAAGMYAQLTTGKPVQIISRTSARGAAHYFEVQMDTKKNEPRIFESKKIDWDHPRGTQVTLEVEGRYQKGRASAEGEEREDGSELARVIRYANRVPLLYQQSACATFKAAIGTAWRNYGVAQSRGALPAGPMVVFVHMASVWVPFTSESKEAIADYDEIRKEIKLALQECGRRLGMFVRRRERAKSEFRRRNIFELYIEEVVEACARLKGGKLPKEKLKAQLQKIAMKRTGGTRTDAILGHDGGPEGLPNSIIVTPEGPEGEAPVLPGAGRSDGAPPDAPRPETDTPAPARRKGKARAARPAKTAKRNATVAKHKKS